MKRLSRRQRRQIEHGDLDPAEILKEKIFSIKTIKPITDNQKKTFDSFYEGKNLLLTGTAGTGKSFISCYLALNEVFEDPTVYKNVTIIRSVVPSRDMGHLPGRIEEKIGPFEAPYFTIFNDMSLNSGGNAYQTLKDNDLVTFISSSFIRGMTLSNTVIVVDEIQNMTAEELHTIFTRQGKNCKIIFCGDIRQGDLKALRQKSGFSDFVKIMNSMKSMDHIEFTKADIVRSAIVKEYIIAREKLEDAGDIFVDAY